MSNWERLRWQDHCQLCPVIWPISLTGIWISAAGSASSATSLWTIVVQRSCWFSFVGRLNISNERRITIAPQDNYKGSWHLQRSERLFCAENGTIEKAGCGNNRRGSAMIGRHTGFIALCKGDPDFPNFVYYHCIILLRLYVQK